MNDENFEKMLKFVLQEEVGSMSSDEFAKHEKEIDAQTRAFNGTMPTMREPVQSLPALACD